MFVLRTCKILVKCLNKRMIRQISCALIVLFLFASCENRYRRGAATSHASSSVDPKFTGKTSDDAYQVSVSEYDDNFISRYGLLYLKSSNDPFSGRILTVDAGESGEFVSSDESWKDGRKHGKSSKWFSNGIKMYERNYKEGRWHGSVTRWWPNGQKMYVRAYTNGVRHGNEATWRSDGTVLSLPADGTPSSPDLESKSVENLDSLPQVNLAAPPATVSENVNEVSGDLNVDPVEPAFAEPAIPLVPSPPVETTEDGFSDLPNFPPMEEPSSSLSDDENLPSLPNTQQDPALPTPSLPDLSANEEALPGLPQDSADGLPELPGLDQADIPSESAPPPLPGLPDTSASEGLPPLPGMEEDSLPPLPGGGDEELGDLPPLPPLP